LTVIAGSSIILGAVYMLALFKKSFFGPVTNDENLKLNDLTGTEIAALVPLVVVVIWLGIAPSPMLQTIDKSVNNTLMLMSHKAQLPETKNTIFIAPQPTMKETK
jgi:NADH-quinone oxidoreductase subunit M